MIKINLAARKKSSLGGKSASTRGGIDLGNLGDKLGDFKDLPTKKYLLAIVPALLFYMTVDQWQDGQLKELDAQIAQVMAEKPKLEAEASKMKQYEDLQKELDEDEKVLRNKLVAIRKLVEGRNTTVTILVNIAKIIPKAVWLTEFQVKGAELSVKGMANDFEPVTDLVKSINENQFFRDAVPVKQSQDEQRKNLIAFELQAKKRN